MSELELVGIHADGEHLVLIDAEGGRHRLVIDDALRAAVRRDRAGLEQARSSEIRPRDIQIMIRAGVSAEDVAEHAGIPVEQVRRYEGPVLAERAHVAGRAQALAIGRDPGAPTLGDLVVDRLAARGVHELTWDARRDGHDPWEVLAEFTAGDRARVAVWQVDLATGTLRALDDESHWLSETDLAPRGQRHLTAVPVQEQDLFEPAPYDIEADEDLTAALAVVDGPRGTRGPEHDTEALVDQLNAARGIRVPLADGDELAADDFPAELWEGEPGAHPAASRPQDADDDTVITPSVRLVAPTPVEPEPDAEPEAEPARDERPRRRNRRTSVPSWDEIVFGAKND